MNSHTEKQCARRSLRTIHVDMFDDEPDDSPPNLPDTVDDQDEYNEYEKQYEQQKNAVVNAPKKVITEYKKMKLSEIAEVFITMCRDPKLNKYVPTLNKGREPDYLQYWINDPQYTFILGKPVEKILKDAIRMYSEQRPFKVFTKSETQALRDEIDKIGLHRNRLITRMHALTTTDPSVQNDYELCDKTLTVLRERLGQLSTMGQKEVRMDEYPHRTRALKLALEIFSKRTPTADTLLETIKKTANPKAYLLELEEKRAKRIADAEQREENYQCEKAEREALNQPEYTGKDLDDYEKTKQFIRTNKFIPVSLKRFEADARKFVDQGPPLPKQNSRDIELLEKTKDLIRRNQFVPNGLLRFKDEAQKCINKETTDICGIVPSQAEIDKVIEMQIEKKFIPANLRHVVKYLATEKSVHVDIVKGNGAWEKPISREVLLRPPEPKVKIVAKNDETISLHPRCHQTRGWYDSDDNSCYKSDDDEYDGEYDDGEYDDGEYDDGEYDDGEYNDGEYDDGEYDDENSHY
jgi:hypothetical protein